jgi:hypothetical protein
VLPSCLSSSLKLADHADAPVLVGGGVPVGWRVQLEVLEDRRGEQLGIGGSAVIKYAMLSTRAANRFTTRAANRCTSRPANRYDDRATNRYEFAALVV